MSMFRAKQTWVLGGLATICCLASCQLISGLNDLDPGTAGAGGMAGASSSTGGIGGEGGEEILECGDYTSDEPECSEEMTEEDEHCDGECRVKMPAGRGGLRVDLCEVRCEGNGNDPEACSAETPNGETTICGPPELSTFCEIRCDGGCAEMVACPPNSPYPCTVFCDGENGSNGCKNTTIMCGNTPDCEIVCENGGCDSTTQVNCGSGECSVRCDASEQPSINSMMACDFELNGECDRPAAGGAGGMSAGGMGGAGGTGGAGGMGGAGGA